MLFINYFFNFADEFGDLFYLSRTEGILFIIGVGLYLATILEGKIQ